MTVIYDAKVRTTKTRTRVVATDDGHHVISCEHGTEYPDRDLGKCAAVNRARNPAEWCDECAGNTPAAAVTVAPSAARSFPPKEDREPVVMVVDRRTRFSKMSLQSATTGENIITDVTRHSEIEEICRERGLTVVRVEHLLPGPTEPAAG